MKQASVQAIFRALNDASIPYLVVGGLAVVAHGYGRYTGDIDLVVRLEPDVIGRTFEALASLGYRPRVPVTAAEFGDPRTRSRWVAEKGMMVLNFHSDRHRETPVDVFASEPFDFAAEHARALIVDSAPGCSVRIVALDTLLRIKRAAGRPAAGPRGHRGTALAPRGGVRQE